MGVYIKLREVTKYISSVTFMWEKLPDDSFDESTFKVNLGVDDLKQYYNTEFSNINSKTINDEDLPLARNLWDKTYKLWESAEKTDNLGYCCLNETLRAQNIYCSRTLNKKKFTKEEASNRALQNCKDLYEILKWNVKNNIRVYRISSDLFPRYTCNTYGYTAESLKDYDEIKSVLEKCGDYAFKHKMFLSFHPGPYTTIASPNKTSAENGIQEVLYHILLCKLIDPDDRLGILINFHVGGSYNKTWKETSMRFISSYNRIKALSKVAGYQHVKNICIENDDQPNCWTVQLLYDYIYTQTKIPITFDVHHWKLNHEDNAFLLSDFRLARSTWPKGVSMQVHYSESGDPDKLVRKHSDDYKNRVDLNLDFYDVEDIHIHLECKDKEKALVKYRDDFLL